MKIAVVAANGRVAQKVIAEALNRGFDVTWFCEECKQNCGQPVYSEGSVQSDCRRP